MNGKLLAQGLLHAKGDELRLVYALIVETKMLDMLVARVKDTFQKETNHFEEDLQNIIDGLKHIPDEQLQLQLFLHIARLLKINGAHYNVYAEIEYACAQIVDEAYTLMQAQQKDFKRYSEGRTEEKAVQLVLYQMHKVFESFDASMDELTEDEQQTFIEKIEAFMKSLPAEKQRELKEKLNIDDLTTQTIRQLIVSQGSVLVLTVLVEVAGFAAFTTLTSTIATIAGVFGATLPFGFYIFATSTLSIVTGPLAIAAAVIGGGALIKWQNDKVKKMFIPIGIVQLLLPVVLEGEKPVHADAFIQEWLKAYDEQVSLVGHIQQLSTALENTTARYEETRDAISQQRSLQQQLRLQLHMLYSAVEAQIVVLNPHSFSTAAYKLYLEMKNCELEIEQHENEKALKRLETGFMAKLKNSLAAVSTNLDIRSLKNDIANKQQHLARELVKQQHPNIHDITEQIGKLEQQLATSIKQMATLERTRDSLKQQQDEEQSALRTLKDELSHLQKSVYGLAHIE